MRVLSIYLSILIATTPIACVAYTPQKQDIDQQQATKQLLKLQTKIQNIEKDIKHDRSNIKDLQLKLKSLDIEIGQTNEQIRQLDINLNEQKLKESTLEKRHQTLSQSKQQHEEQLAALLLQAYKNLQNERWQILLTDTDLTSKMRLNRYFQQLSQTQTKEIQTLIEHLSDIQTTAHQLEQAKTKTIALKEKFVNKRNQLTTAQQSRTAVLSQLNQQLNQNETVLSQLKGKQEVLEKVLENLKVGLSKLPAYIEPALKFEKAKRQLYFPIQEEYATLLAVTQSRQKADKKTYIEADIGTPVYAVYSGRVVFAEWLRGIGLLLILDHGNGYMSLYGNNDILYKSVGDWVNKAEMVARVGQSGGHSNPGLYFELRKDGVALNPQDWFNKS